MRLPLALAAALAAAAVAAPPDIYYRAARADGFGNVPYWHQGHDYGFPHHYRYGWVAPSYWASRPWAVPPLPPYVPRDDGDRLRDAVHAGQRALELGQFARALAQLRGARNLAVEMYGPASQPARELRGLLWQAEYELWLRGGGKDGRDHDRALASGDAARGEGAWGRAEIGYHDALLRATTRAQAGVARARLEALRALRPGGDSEEPGSQEPPGEAIGRAPDATSPDQP